MKIAIIQSELHWENIELNLQMFEEKIAGINQAVDLILLPEMFSTAFSMNPERTAEGMDGKALSWMKSQAAATGALICGSLSIKENEHYYNRFICAEPSGKFHSYDKKHLFRLSDEMKRFTPGNHIMIVKWKDWNIRIAICYDLRFPVWLRNTQGENSYDLLLISANWPTKRLPAWNALLKARAIENMCYVAGVNRVGHDENGWDFGGSSAIYGPLGEQMVLLGEDEEATAIGTLDNNYLHQLRQDLPFLLDGDGFVFSE